MTANAISAVERAPLRLVSDAPPPKRLLVVDDEEAIRLALSKFLRTRGFEVQAAESGAAALELLRAEKFTLMLCDVRMPGLSGIEVVKQAVALDPELAVLMLSAVNDATTAAQALNGGALDYLSKPVELVDLHRAVERGLHRRELMLEQRRIEQVIREEVAQRTAELEQRSGELQQRSAELEQERATLRALTVDVAETLINAMEAKDIYLRGHSQRVAELAASMAEELALHEDVVESVRLAGRLHDVGKIGIREAVLNKPGRLTDEEFDHVKDHVRIGMEILAPLKHLGVVLDYVRDHHEHWDGSGYPNGKRADEISIGGQILCAADAFDAITSKRAYRDGLPAEETLTHLTKSVGVLFNQRVYETLCSIVRRRSLLVFLDPK